MLIDDAQISPLLKIKINHAINQSMPYCTAIQEL